MTVALASELFAPGSTAELIVAHQPMPCSIASTVLTVKGLVWRGGQGWWKPIFCANCGRDGGLVPEHADFAFYLCDRCEHFGAIEGIYMEPDRIYWAKAELEMQERYGRRLTIPELLDVVAADASPLATLLAEGR